MPSDDKFKKTSDVGVKTVLEEEEDDDDDDDDDDLGDVARAEVFAGRFEEGGGLKDKAMAGLFIR